MEKEIKVKGNKLKVLLEMFGNEKGKCSTIKIYGNGNIKDIYLGNREEWIEGITGISFCSDRTETIILHTELDDSILIKRVSGEGSFKIKI